MNPEHPKSFSWLLASIREDYATNRRDWSQPGFHVLVVYRFGVWVLDRKRLAAKLLRIVYALGYVLVRNFYSVDIHRYVKLGRRLSLPHAAGIFIHHEVEIGDDCLIRQGTTIGIANDSQRRRLYAPRIGNRVEIGAGAVIVGGVTIGDGARIGPNAVVMTDVPAGGSAFATPARILKPLTSHDPSTEASAAER